MKYFPISLAIALLCLSMTVTVSQVYGETDTSTSSALDALDDALNKTNSGLHENGNSESGNKYEKKNKVSRASYGMTVEHVDAREHKASFSGAYLVIDNISPDKPADKAGIKLGDKIKEVDRKGGELARDLLIDIMTKAPHKVVVLTIVRDDEIKTIEVTPGERE